MLLINAQTTNPYFNLAMEEYILTNFKEDCFILWQNEPSIIIGRNQNTIAEINADYIHKNKIPVVRRLTGGGAVFHDLGNVNFTFIAVNKPKYFNDFRMFTSPILDYLKSKGINAEFTGRNDLTINGRKFSGNAQCNLNHNIMHHGTLLYSSEISNLSKALTVKPIKLQSKGVKSVSSRVTNIKEHMPQTMSVLEFKNDLFNYVSSHVHESKVYELNNIDIQVINELVNSKYSTWNWNYGESPKYELLNSIRYKGGNIDFCLNIKRGIITNIKIYGDFFGIKPIDDLENIIKETSYNEEAIKERLENINLQDYLSGIDKDIFINGILL